MLLVTRMRVRHAFPLVQILLTGIWETMLLSLKIIESFLISVFSVHFWPGGYETKADLVYSTLLIRATSN